MRFFLWGYLNSQVYRRRVQTLEILKEVILREIAAISPELTSSVVDGYRERPNQYIENDGRNFSDEMFKNS